MNTILSVKIRVRAPFVTRSNSTGGFGVDAPLAKSSQGKPYIPGTLVLGKIAEAYRQLSQAFGDRGAAENSFGNDLKLLLAGDSQDVDGGISTGREARRRILCGDFVLTSQEKRRVGTRCRIAMEPVTGTVSESMLQIIEQPFAPGEFLEFSGEIRVKGGADDAQLRRLKKALSWIEQLGALRSVGFGEVAEIDIEDITNPSSTVSIDPPALHIILRLSLRDPFCVGEKRNTRNTYDSADVIPGGVIKGAIANQIAARFGLSGDLSEHVGDRRVSEQVLPLLQYFNEVRFRHAFPIKKEQKLSHVRSGPVPLSLALNGDHFVDLAVDPRGGGGTVALKLSNNWKAKDWGRAKSRLDIPEVDKELRIRTQIDSQFRAAKQDRLFGINYVLPDKHDFVSIVDLPQGAEVVVAALQEVLATGLAGIGRGGAYADCMLEPCSDEVGHAPSAGARRVVMTLKTHALLRAPEGARRPHVESYGDVFAGLGLPSGVKLADAFVDEMLLGGAFMSNRQKNVSTMSYRPWLATKAGSVFVFDLREGVDVAKAHETFKRWDDSGLPMPGVVQEFHGLGDVPIYRVCPYTPENGYGEVQLRWQDQPLTSTSASILNGLVEA